MGRHNFFSNIPTKNQFSPLALIEKREAAVAKQVELEAQRLLRTAANKLKTLETHEQAARSAITQQLFSAQLNTDSGEPRIHRRGMLLKESAETKQKPSVSTKHVSFKP